MHSECAKALAEMDDIRLFCGRACHIFAVVLHEMFPQEKYSLRRVVVTDFQKMEGFHVYAHRAPFMVDACGIRREADYLAWLVPHRQELTEMECKVGTVDEPNPQDFLKTSIVDGNGIPNNRWKLWTDEEFVVVARKRACALIEHWKNKYRASLLAS
jgi:hypothetical protein